MRSTVYQYVLHITKGPFPRNNKILNFMLQLFERIKMWENQGGPGASSSTWYTSPGQDKSTSSPTTPVVFRLSNDEMDQRSVYEFGPFLFKLVSNLQQVVCAPEVSHYIKKQNLFQTTENPKLYRLFSMKRIMKTQLTEL